MRVEERAAAGRAAERSEAGRRFGEALARARRTTLAAADALARRATLTGADVGTGRASRPVLSTPRAGEPSGAAAEATPALAADEGARGREDRIRRPRTDPVRGREQEREAHAGESGAARRDPPSAAAPAAPAGADAPELPELRALVRTLPVAVHAGALRAGAPLALSCGRSLDVELRAAPGGVEVVLRAEGGVARACEAALPGLLAALERRGVAVARAEVRGRGRGAGRPAAR